MAMTETKKDALREQLRSRVQENQWGKEIVPATEEEIKWLNEKAKESNFFNSLSNSMEQYGDLSLNQFIYVFNSMQNEQAIQTLSKIPLKMDIAEKESKRKDKQTGEVKITKYKTIEVETQIININEVQFVDKYSQNYGGWGHVNYTEKKVYTGVSGDFKIVFWGGKRTEAIEENKTYLIKARVKQETETEIKINYIRDVQAMDIPA